MQTLATRRLEARSMAWRLATVVVAMFGFGYALVPLYDVLCDITGLNGKTGVVQAADVVEPVDTSRLVTVQFTGTVNSRLPWAFTPTQRELRVHPGQIYEASFEARNLTDRAVVGQAVPSVAPLQAATYFNKTECFCFTQQTLQAGETRTMPLRFVLDRDLPPGVTTVTLSYTFFRVDQAG